MLSCLSSSFYFRVQSKLFRFSNRLVSSRIIYDRCLIDADVPAVFEIIQNVKVVANGEVQLDVLVMLLSLNEKTILLLQ